MISCWTRFAHTGDPNGKPTGEAPHWPPVDPNTPRSQELRTGAGGITPVDAATAHLCAFWDAIDPD